MALIILDIIASIIQSILFAYTIIYCVDKNEKIDKIKLFSMSIIFLLNRQFFTGIFGNNWGITIFVTHIIGLGITIAFYKKNILNALVAYTISYSFIMLISIICSSMYIITFMF